MLCRLSCHIHLANPCQQFFANPWNYISFTKVMKWQRLSRHFFCLPYASTELHFPTLATRKKIPQSKRERVGKNDIKWRARRRRVMSDSSAAKRPWLKPTRKIGRNKNATSDVESTADVFLTFFNCVFTSRNAIDADDFFVCRVQRLLVS